MTVKRVKTTQEKERIAKNKEIQKETVEAVQKERECDQSFVEVKKLTGEVVRAYTRKDHGREFVELAKEFAKKNAYIANVI